MNNYINCIKVNGVDYFFICKKIIILFFKICEFDIKYKVLFIIYVIKNLFDGEYRGCVLFIIDIYD